MCNKIDPQLVENAVGCFDKREDGQVQHFPILVTLCDCEEVYWARVPGGTIWVQATKEDPHVDPKEAEAFAAAVAETQNV